jgi:hypothetical protein
MRRMPTAPLQVPERPSASTALLCAVAAPPLLAFNLSPSATLLNQLLAFFGWGLVLLAVRADGRAFVRARWALLALAGLMAAVLGSMAQSLPVSLGLSALVTLLVAAAVLGAATGAADDDSFHAFASALLVAGLASAAIGVIQVFLPDLADGVLIARSGLVGRAVGNLRQPNHLSSLLLWSLIALVPLARAGRVFSLRLPAATAALLGALLVWAVVLTASRTGALGVLMLALWGIVDRRMDRRMRSEERRVGKECRRLCRSRWSPYH